MNNHIYILASRRHGTLYVGVTNNLAARIIQHREGRIPGFTKRYGIREKRIKEWQRDWKIELIERDNPLWIDLAVSMLGLPPIAPRITGKGGVHGSRLSPG